MLVNAFSKGVCRSLPGISTRSLSISNKSSKIYKSPFYNDGVNVTTRHYVPFRSFNFRTVNDEIPAVNLHQHIYLGGVGFVSELTKACNKFCEFFNSFTYSDSKSKMSASLEAMAELENNAQVADALVQEIYSKLTDLQSCNPELGVEVQKLVKENESLKLELEKWKEMVILQQIRNGGNPIVRDPKLIERSAVVAATEEAKPANAAPNNDAEVKTETPAAAPQKEGKKGKKGGGEAGAQKGGGGGAAKSKEAADNSNKSSETDLNADEVDVGRLDLRIGLIKECTRHPDADSLYVEKIDVGEPNVRTVISGLVKHVPIEAMQNRMVVVLCNLKPSKMRGITSEAMVMCASSPEKVEILLPPSGSAPGDVVEVEGFKRRPDPVLNPKKKIFETVAPDLKTNDQKQATYKGVPWTVPTKGFVISETLCGVNVK